MDLLDRVVLLYMFSVNSLFLSFKHTPPDFLLITTNRCLKKGPLFFRRIEVRFVEDLLLWWRWHISNYSVSHEAGLKQMKI